MKHTRYAALAAFTCIAIVALAQPAESPPSVAIGASAVPVAPAKPAAPAAPAKPLQAYQEIRIRSVFDSVKCYKGLTLVLFNTRVPFYELDADGRPVPCVNER